MVLVSRFSPWLNCYYKFHFLSWATRSPVHRAGKGCLCVIVLLYALFLPHLFFCAFLLLLCTAYVDILRSLGGIHQQSDTVIDDLRESGSDRKISPTRPRLVSCTFAVPTTMAMTIFSWFGRIPFCPSGAGMISFLQRPS